MNALEFVDKSASLAPSLDVLKEASISESLFEEFISNFKLPIVKVTESNISPVLDILFSCDVSTFCVFAFTFLPLELRVGNYIIFAENEANSIGINLTDGRIFMIGYEDVEGFEERGEITNVYPCARDGKMFLDALLHAVELYKIRITKSFSGSLEDVIKRYALECIQLAGGDENRIFWFNMLGAYE